MPSEDDEPLDPNAPVFVNNLGQEPKKVLYQTEDGQNLVFQDKNMKVYPVPFSNKNKDVYSFLCVPPQGNREFLPKKAKDIKGLVPKEHFKLLTDGHSVTLKDGTIVTPEMATAPPKPAQCFGFIFLPDVEFLESFLAGFEKSQFRDFFVDKIEETKQLVAIYHSIPKCVMENPKYLALLAKFGPAVKHILDCPESNFPVLSRSRATNFTENIK